MRVGTRIGFWQQVVRAEMAVPDDNLADLTAELVTMLGSPDPVVRDELALPVLATWIESGVYDDLLVSLGDSLVLSLRDGLGEDGTDTVFRRSFTALVVGVCADRDTAARVVPADAVVNWAEHGLTWFLRERDHRGFVPGQGWAHAVAHGADLLTAFAQSPHLDGDHLGVLLDVVADRVATPTAYTWGDGEADRLAVTVLTVLQRDLVTGEVAEGWVRRVGDTAAGINERTPEDSDYRASRHAADLLRAVYVHLSLNASPAGSQLDFSRPPDVRADVLLALAGELRRATPWMFGAGAAL